MNIFRKIVEWFRRKFTFKYSSNYKVEVVRDIPDIVPERKILIVDEGAPESLVFKCPCGCKADVQLNLLADARPLWKYKINEEGNITISPSIWRTAGCRSHFFVREGKIEWV